MARPLYPEITVWLPEPNIINAVERALRRNIKGYRADTFRYEALHCRDYTELVDLLKRWITVI